MKNDKSIFFKSLKPHNNIEFTLLELKPRFPQFSDFIDFETERLNGLINFEKELCDFNNNIEFKNNSIAGVDEAGRGPLAGPVVACAVYFENYNLIPFINDSKKMTHELREFTAKIIRNKAKVGIGIVTAEEIDRINILQATFKAMRLAVQNLGIKPDFVLVDGNKKIPDLKIPQKAVTKGDLKSYSIACASIIAKTVRDSMICECDKIYPQYGFAKHKGYGTKEHIEAIYKYGQLDGIHRKTFNIANYAPLDALLPV